MSGVLQGSVHGPLQFILFVTDMWNNFENKVVSSADDTIFPDCVKCGNSLNKDLLRIQIWFSTPGELSLTQIKLIQSFFQDLEQLFHNIHLCRVELETSTYLKCTFVILQSQLPRRLTGLIRKCFKTLDNDDAFLKSFYAFILPYFEYYSPAWCYELDSHLRFFGSW